MLCDSKLLFVVWLFFSVFFFLFLILSFNLPFDVCFFPLRSISACHLIEWTLICSDIALISRCLCKVICKIKWKKKRWNKHRIKKMQKSTHTITITKTERSESKALTKLLIYVYFSFDIIAQNIYKWTLIVKFTPQPLFHSSIILLYFVIFFPRWMEIKTLNPNGQKFIGNVAARNQHSTNKQKRCEMLQNFDRSMRTVFFIIYFYLNFVTICKKKRERRNKQKIKKKFTSVIWIARIDQYYFFFLLFRIF